MGLNIKRDSCFSKAIFALNSGKTKEFPLGSQVLEKLPVGIDAIREELDAAEAEAQAKAEAEKAVAPGGVEAEVKTETAVKVES